NSNKKEKAPDGSVDENVFDIQQGVSINIFIKNKTNRKRKLQMFYILVYLVHVNINMRLLIIMT
ncbi:MAG: hypothetical protein ACE5GV_12625, partial [Candidatus Scalindua sp.]